VSFECNVGDRVARHLIELTLALDLAVAHFRPRVLRVGYLLDLLLALFPADFRLVTPKRNDIFNKSVHNGRVAIVGNSSHCLSDGSNGTTPL